MTLLVPWCMKCSLAVQHQVAISTVDGALYSGEGSAELCLHSVEPKDKRRIRLRRTTEVAKGIGEGELVWAAQVPLDPPGCKQARY